MPCPRGVAGRGDRLSDLRHVAGGDGRRRLYRRAGGGDVVRPGEPPHAAEEDASFAGFYLGSLALGVTLVSLRGSSVDLLHVLFG